LPTRILKYVEKSNEVKCDWIVAMLICADNNPPLLEGTNPKRSPLSIDNIKLEKIKKELFKLI